MRVLHTSQYILRECVLCLCESGNANKLWTLSPNKYISFVLAPALCHQMQTNEACFQSNEGNIIQHIWCGSEIFKLWTKSGHFSAREDIVEVWLFVFSAINLQQLRESHWRKFHGSEGWLADFLVNLRWINSFTRIFQHSLRHSSSQFSLVRSLTCTLGGTYLRPSLQNKIILPTLLTFSHKNIEF